MPANKIPPSLRAEVSKLARLSHVQNGLPPAMRALPLVAIALGEAISRATKNPTNLIEERMLGPDETFQLGGPSVERTVTVGGTAHGHQPAGRGPEGREGVAMMCVRCAKQKVVTGRGFEELRGIYELGTVKYLAPPFVINGAQSLPKATGAARS